MYRSYDTKEYPLSPFIANRIHKLGSVNQAALEDYVNAFCHRKGWLEEGVENFRAYSATINLFADTSCEDAEDMKTAVLFVIYKWFSEQGIDALSD